MTKTRLPARPNALGRLAQRRAAIAGRGVLLDVHEVLGVEAVRMVEHGEPGVTMPPGAVLLEVWGGDPKAVLNTVHAARPPKVQILVIHHARAGLLQRAAAWWRWTVYRWRRATRRG